MKEESRGKMQRESWSHWLRELTCDLSEFLVSSVSTCASKDNRFKEKQRIKTLANKVSASFEISSASHAFAFTALPPWRWCSHTG